MTYKLVIVGSGGSGKSTFVKKLLTDKFEKKYNPTIGVEVKKYEEFEIWDCAGQEKFKGLSDGFYIGCNCAIIMFDGLSPSFREIRKYRRVLRTSRGNIPIVICFNHFECRDRLNFRFLKDDIVFHFSVETDSVKEPIEFLREKLSSNNQ